MKLKLTISTSLLGLNLLGQTPVGFPPAPYPATTPPTAVPVANSAWYRGGNSNTGTAGVNNIFGTMWNSPVFHYTTGKQRMTVWDDTYSGPIWGTPFGGGVTINYDPANPIVQPLSLLTIGDNIGVGGWRKWMSVGTFNNFGSDNMYIGLKNEGSVDRQDAVINWGDNTTTGGAIYGPDYLRFIFTAPQFAGYPGFGASADGLETMRINHLGRIGIGNYYNSLVESPFSKDPARRLEILSDKTSAGVNGNPLLRLTHSQQNPSALLTTGRYSEFQPMANGNLFISTRDNTLPTTLAKDFKERFVGFNTNTPGNTVEINSQFGTAATANGFGGTGWAGLRFTDLKSTSTPNTLVTNKVLSVDANGDVILVTNTPPVSGLGNICGATVVPLLGNYQIEMTPAFNFNYTMPAYTKSQVNIGYPACTTNSARIAVFNDTLRAAGGFTTEGFFNPPAKSIVGLARNFQLNTGSNNPGAIGVTGIAEAAGQASIIGVLGQSIVSLHGDNYGGFFEAKSSLSTNIGVNTGAKGGSTAIGLKSKASDGANVNIGVSGVAYKTGFLPIPATYPGGISIGIYGNVSVSTAPSIDYAGYFDGNVFINGVGASPGPGLIFSDKNIKTNVATVAKPLDLLLRLRPVSYNINNAYAPQLNVDTAKTFGLIAQEVAVLFPTLVKEVIVPASYDTLGTVITPSVSLKALNYTGLIPLTISAIQDINTRQNTMQASLNKAGLSDALVKNNINNFNALAKIKTLNPVSYNFTNTGVPQLSFSPKLDYGFIAQQLQTVYPELVDTIRVPAKLDSLGAVINPSVVLKTVNYKAMSGLLTRAIQEQQVKIDSLLNVASKQDSINKAVQTQLSNLTSLINGCCEIASRKNNPVNSLDVELSDKDAIVLSQNVPNPFAEQTTITYNVPASVGKAQILFYNNTGQVIQTVDIKTRGKGKVNVFASDLSAGLYHYTLVADGKVIDSKKMVRE